MVRLASSSDLEKICEIYEKIHDETENGTMQTGWIRGVYPVRETAENAIKNGEMYVLERAGKVVASARINPHQEESYRKIDWRYKADDDKVLVLHTLTVSPLYKGEGIATEFVAFYEELAKKCGRPFLRIDTNFINNAARCLYKKLGFYEAGMVPCDFNGIKGIMLVCLEKNLLIEEREEQK